MTGEHMNIYFLTWQEMLSEIKGVGNGVFSKNEIQEHKAGFYLALLQALSRQKPMLLGTVRPEGNKFDIAIAPAADVSNGATTQGHPLPGVISVQLKDIYIYDQQKELSVEEWRDFVQSAYLDRFVGKYGTNTCDGILHLTNAVSAQVPLITSQMEALLRTFTFGGSSFEQVSLSVGIADEVRTWEIYPTVKYLGPVSQRQVPHLVKLYSQIA